MWINDFKEKVFQTLPGNGWRALIAWNPDAADRAEGHPEHTLEIVIAWVTLKVERHCKRTNRTWENVIIAPLVRDTLGGQLLILDDGDGCNRQVAYLAPGEELGQHHFDQLRGSYVKAVTLG
jgi:hypothetical protein